MHARKRRPGGFYWLQSIAFVGRSGGFEVTVCDLKDAAFWLFCQCIFLRLSTFQRASGFTAAALAIDLSGKMSSGR